MTHEQRPAVVFDCMVYLQAVISEAGPAAAALRLLDHGRITVYVSAELLGELQDVLTRSKIRSKKPRITDQRVAALLQRLSDKAKHVDAIPKQFVCERDPDDEPYINLAIAAAAKFLVSRDKDLLDLMNDADFRARFPDLTILDPVAFLDQITKITPPQQDLDSTKEQASL